MAKLACEFGIQRAIVRHLDEAEQIAPYFTHILILSPVKIKCDPKFSYVINDLSDISRFPKNCSVHLKVDTGMHRNGINADELENAYQLITQKSLSLDGVMTHFRSADELGSEYFWQLMNWRDVKANVLKLTVKYHLQRPLFHSANSAALLRAQTHEDDFARCGIATYGYQHMPSSFQVPSLKPVLSLWAEKISSRTLHKGQSVGYGGTYQAAEDIKISTYDIGYGDGFFRFDGKGSLTTASNEPFLGRVSMDSCVTASQAQKVCLFDDAVKIANYFNTISYDVLTKLSSKIPRVIIH